MEQCAPVIVLLKLTTDRHEASRGLCATAETCSFSIWRFNDVQYGGRPPFKKNYYLVMRLSPSSKYAVVYRISSKSDDFYRASAH